MSTFTWTPDWGARATVKPTVKTTKFGDGYEWRQAVGINSVVEAWDLSFALRDLDEGNDILDFLTTAGGVQSFDWTNPLGVAGKYVCREWPHSFENFNRLTFNLTFEKVYEP